MNRWSNSTVNFSWQRKLRNFPWEIMNAAIQLRMVAFRRNPVAIVIFEWTPNLVIPGFFVQESKTPQTPFSQHVLLQPGRPETLLGQSLSLPSYLRMVSFVALRHGLQADPHFHHSLTELHDGLLSTVAPKILLRLFLFSGLMFHIPLKRVLFVLQILFRVSRYCKFDRLSFCEPNFILMLTYWPVVSSHAVSIHGRQNSNLILIMSSYYAVLRVWVSNCFGC